MPSGALISVKDKIPSIEDRKLKKNNLNGVKNVEKKDKITGIPLSGWTEIWRIKGQTYMNNRDQRTTPMIHQANVKLFLMSEALGFEGTAHLLTS